jgi:fluoride ion exporter CrcB/FEX
MGLLQNGKFGMALIYIALSIILGISATFLGYQLIKN